jgi:methylenetetrahydrofolate reductase (NADPH)
MNSDDGIPRQNVLRTALESGRFLCTAELDLGRDHTTVEAETFVRAAAQQDDGVKVVSVTDLAGGNPALPPESFVSYVIEHNLTPIAHLTGKDGNRAFMEGRLDSLARLGVENVLAMTGDAQKEAFEGRPKPVYDLDSVLILELIQAMRSGLEYSVGARTERTTPFDFFPGAVVNPYKVGEPDQMMQFYKLELKVAAAAQFIITQAGFNIRKLYELKQYMSREGLGHVPVLANIYVPTAKIAQMMQSGELAGFVASDAFVKRLESEKKPQRLERGALMLAAVKDLGFAGAHIGGFGLTYEDFMTLEQRAADIGKDWRARMDELVFAYPGEFYLLPPGREGLSDGTGDYQLSAKRRRLSFTQRVSLFVDHHLIAEGSAAGRFFAGRLRPKAQASPGNSWRRGFWYRILGPSRFYREATLGCVRCDDCVVDYLNYAACPMRSCYKQLRNGPCGGSRVDGTCEVRPEQPCIWNVAYLSTVTLGEDPKKFARTLIPPRDWSLDHTNALANRTAGVDNLLKRKELVVTKEARGGQESASHA